MSHRAVLTATTVLERTSARPNYAREGSMVCTSTRERSIYNYDDERRHRRRRHRPASKSRSPTRKYHHHASDRSHREHRHHPEPHSSHHHMSSSLHSAHSSDDSSSSSDSSSTSSDEPTRKRRHDTVAVAHHARKAAVAADEKQDSDERARKKRKRRHRSPTGERQQQKPQQHPQEQPQKQGDEEEHRHRILSQVGRLFNTDGTVESAKKISMSLTSMRLPRDEMVSVITPTANDPKSDHRPIILSDTARHIFQPALKDLVDVMRSNSLYNFVASKLWSSICPSGIDVVFGTESGPIRPSTWFVDSVINGIWIHEVRQLFESLLLVGYVAVAYGPSQMLDDEMCPHTVDPLDYVLEWRTDQNSERYYTAYPRASRIPRGDDRSPMFEACDVFVEDRPTQNGRLRSRARSCFREIVFLQQTLNDYQLLDHGRATAPIIVQSQRSWADSIPPWATGGRGMGRSGVLDIVRAQMDQQPAPTSAQQPPMDGAEVHLRLHLQHRMEQSLQQNVVQHQTLQQAVDWSSDRQTLSELYSVDPADGTLEVTEPNAMWQQGQLALPPGMQLANMKLADPPREFAKIVHQMVSLVCGVMGVPAELLIGGTAASARVSSAMASQELLRATVMWWRNTLCKYMARMYKRIYGKYHLVNLSKCFDHPLKPSEARKATRGIAVEFRFRSDRLEYPMAYQMFQNGVLTGERLARAAMEQYGLSEDDVEVPRRPADLALMRAAVSSSIHDPPSAGKKKSGYGDNSPSDTASIGFADHVRTSDHKDKAPPTV